MKRNSTRNSRYVTTGSFMAVSPPGKTGTTKRRGTRNRKVGVKAKASTPRKKNRRTTTPGFALGGMEYFKAIVSAAVVCAFIIGIGVAGRAGWELLLESERFEVRDVQIHGNRRVAKEDIELYTGVRTGASILGLDLDEAALNLRRHPWIRSARLQRRLPDALVVHIEEHEPRMLVSIGGMYVANGEGQLFKRLATSDRIVGPVLTGLSASGAEREGGEKGARVIRDAVALRQVFDGTSLGRLEELHWDEHLGWSVLTNTNMAVYSIDAKGARAASAKRPSLLRVHLGFDPVPRLELAMRAQARLTKLGRQASELWIDGTRHPERVHVRMSENQQNSGQPTLIAKAR